MTLDNGEFDFGYLGTKIAADEKIDENLNSTTVNSLPTAPAGLTFSVENTGVSVQANNADTNRLLSFTGALASALNTDNPPGTSPNTKNFREFRATFITPSVTKLTASFRAYEGRSSGEYLLTEPPDNGTEDFLYFQYSIDDGTNWITAKEIRPGNGVDANRPYWDLTQVVTATIEASDLIDAVRWITSTNSASTSDDEWGIDDIFVFKTPDISDNDKQVEILSGTDLPEAPFISFTENYQPSYQLNQKTVFPIWHRIGVPSYNKVTVTEDWDDDFFDTYVHTDGIDFIERTAREHDTLGVSYRENLKIKVNAIKKLLPYEGFYPQDRTVQLTNLFVEKVAPDISHPDGISKGQATQAALQHFFAPGILYNSIKAGIACDWASYTNINGTEPSYIDQPVQVYNYDGTTNSHTPELKYTTAPPSWYVKFADNDATDGPGVNAAESYVYYSVNIPAVAGSTAVASLKPAPNPILSGQYLYGGTLVFQEEVTGSFYSSGSVDGFLINKEPDKRLPFEAILNPVPYLLDGRDGDKINWNGKSLVGLPDAEAYVISKPNQHFLMKPSYYKDYSLYNFTYDPDAFPVQTRRDYDSLPASGSSYSFPSFEIKGNNSASDVRYEMAMNNFIAESTKFFIKDEKLLSFSATRPEGQGYLLSSDKTYYMDVVMSKDSAFNPVNSPGSLGGRYFGPPVAYTKPSQEFFNSRDKISDLSYLPYTPPYFFGEQVARISFNPTATGLHSLDDILENLVINEFVTEDTQRFYAATLSRLGRGTDPDSGNPIAETTRDKLRDFYNSPSFKSRMPLESSVEMRGKTKLLRQTFDELGNVQSLTTSDNNELDTWVIYSKFECPLFDFSDFANKSSQGALENFNLTSATSEVLSTDSYEYSSSFLSPSNSSSYLLDKRTGSGIWAGLGQQPTRGVNISIRESFSKDEASETTGSLLQVCGFTPQTKQVGRVADEKEITEAIVMIPYLDEPVTIEQRLYGGGSRQVYATTEVDDRNFIKIDKLEYRRQKRKFDKKDVVYTNEVGTEIRETSITSMIEGMRKYNIPPLYDFETFDQDPFAMYFFEFKHTLDKEDLSNIWQGIQPKIAKEAKLDSVEFSHDINENELFGNLGKLPTDVRWMTFKVKRKAEKSYYNLTEDSRDDSRFKFKFANESKEPEYGYNYPYDYFTMLEMIQVEANSEKEVDPHELYIATKGTEEE